MCSNVHKHIIQVNTQEFKPEHALSFKRLSRHRKIAFYLNKKLPVCSGINPWRQNPEALILACRWGYVIAKVKQFEIHQANKLHLNGHVGLSSFSGEKRIFAQLNPFIASPSQP